MSYDIYLEPVPVACGCDHADCCSKENDAVILDGPTYNLAPMFKKAIPGGLKALDGMLAEDAAPILLTGINDMLTFPGQFEMLNPENGWGTYQGALYFLQQFQIACRQNPKHKVCVL